LHVTVKNNSSRSINGLFLRLDQILSLKASNEDNEEQTVHRKETIINAIVENTNISGGQVYSQDLMIEIPTNVPGTIRHGNSIGRHYELNLDVELSISGSMSISVPILLLEWSPLLKGIVPDVVQVKVRPDEIKESSEEEENILDYSNEGKTD